MESPIKDLIEMLKNFKEANIEELLLTAYKRGFADGKEITIAKIIEDLSR